jgi:uracil-DNA glycosylase
VFGEGQPRAQVMFIGEQPGDQEDRAGKPFVGPAGRMLDEALAEVGVDRTRVYVTNVVKHFKWEARGKRRIHSKPNAREIRACRPWLEAELEDVATVHPASILRAPDPETREAEGRAFVEDLRTVQHLLE